MDQIFQRLLANDFSELGGMIVDASVPVPQSLINELIAESLRGNRSIESCQVTVQAQNKIVVAVKTTLLPWPINLKLKLDKFVDFASYSSPKIRAWMENNRLLGSIGSLLNALPEGIKIYGEQVVIDLGAFAHTPQQKRWLAFVKSVDIRTEAGKVILNAKIEVND
jgi:hypothetical protein